MITKRGDGTCIRAALTPQSFHDARSALMGVVLAELPFALHSRNVDFKGDDSARQNHLLRRPHPLTVAGPVVLDPDGALYKMFNTFTSGTSGVEKRTREYESNDDLSDFVRVNFGRNRHAAKP